MVFFFSYDLRQLFHLFPIKHLYTKASYKLLLHQTYFKNKQIVLSFFHVFWLLIQIKFFWDYIMKNTDYSYLSR